MRSLHYLLTWMLLIASVDAADTVPPSPEARPAAAEAHEQTDEAKERNEERVRPARAATENDAGEGKDDDKKDDAGPAPGAAKPEGSDDDDEKSEESAKLSLTATQQEAVGIRIESPRALAAAPQIQAYGTVLDPVELLTDAGRLDSTRAAAAAANADAARQAGLYRDGVQASLRTVQASQAQSVEAHAQAQAAALSFHQQWGPLAQLSEPQRQSLLAAVVRGKRLLVRADVPGRHFGEVGREALVDVDGVHMSARVLGVLPRVDAQSQSAGWLLELERSPPGLGAGARAAVRLQAATVKGLLVPAAALVYASSGTYVYRRIAGGKADTFAYEAVAVHPLTRVGEGWVVHGLGQRRPDRRAGRRRAVVAARASAASRRPKRNTTSHMLAAIVRGSLAHPRIVTALSLLDRLLGGGALLQRTSRRVSRFRPAARAGTGRGARAWMRPRSSPWSRVRWRTCWPGAENVEAVRSTSSQGLSAIQVVFGRDGDPYRQRQVITERLADASALLPAGRWARRCSRRLSSSMEYLLHFGFTSERLSPMELRDLMRWTIKPQILAVPGVAQAQIFGGDCASGSSGRSRSSSPAAGVTLEDVFEAARRGTQMIGGGYLETPTQRIVLQAQAPGASLEALGQTVVATRDGVPVRIADVARGAGRLRTALRRCDHRRQARDPGRDLHAVRRQHARRDARSGAPAGGAGAGTRAARRQVPPGAAAAGELHRECHREAAQLAADRRGAGGGAAAA